LGSIICVLLHRAGDQVARIAAVARVASVADDKPFGDRAMGKLVGDPVSLQSGGSPPAAAHVAVAATVHGGKPQPASIRTGNGDLLPKLVGQRPCFDLLHIT
jgi:hypothetical protein